MSDGNFDLPNYNYFFGYIDRTKYFQRGLPPQYGLDETQPPSDFNQDFNIHFKHLKKWVKYPSRKTWSFSMFNYYGARNPSWCWNAEVPGMPDGSGVFGLNIRADMSFNMDDGGNHDSMWGLGADGLTTSAHVVRFAKGESTALFESGLIDWGGVEELTNDDGEVVSIGSVPRYKFYARAIYNDGSETLPTHKFLFGSATTGYTNGGDYLQFNPAEYLDSVYSLSLIHI